MLKPQCEEGWGSTATRSDGWAFDGQKAGAQPPGQNAEAPSHILGSERLECNRAVPLDFAWKHGCARRFPLRRVTQWTAVDTGHVWDLWSTVDQQVG